MKRKNTTRNALFTSIISMLLCVSMLVGTTFAWFTDKAESGLNQIIAGNLDVELLYKDGNAYKNAANVKLFDDIELWEPGMVAYETVKIANVGKLALKYALSINTGNENTLNGHGLSEVLHFAVIDGEIGSKTRAEVLALAEASANKGMLTTYTFGSFNELLANTESDPMTLVVYWPATTNEFDNLFNVNNGQKTSDGAPLHIDLGLKVLASQETVEKDSFDKYYDDTASYPTNKWLGDVAEKLVIDEATKTITISSGAELALFAKNVNGGTTYAGYTVKLTDSIDLNNIAWTPIGGYKMGVAADGKDIRSSFKGIFDGDGKTIYNLNTSDSYAAGLFGSATSGTIKNLNIVNAKVSSNHYAAAISAHGLCTRVENCSVKNAVITTSAEQLAGGTWDNGDKAGAIVGYLSAEPTAYVKGCTVTNAKITGYRDIGGVVGYANAAAEVTGNTVTDVEVVCDLAHNYKNYQDADEFDIGKIVGDGSADASNTATNVTIMIPDMVIPGTTITLYKADIPQEGGIIYLNSAEDFWYLNELANNWDSITTPNGNDHYHYRWDWEIVLNCDVDLENKEWTPMHIGAFGGFDGQGHTISNLKISGTADNAALFSSSYENSSGKCPITNFVVDGATVSGANKVAVVVGWAAGSPVSNITVKNATVNGAKYVGGIAGKTNSSIENCTVINSSIVANANGAENKEVGGIAAFLTVEGSGESKTAKIENCSVKNTTVSGADEVGGIVGRAYALNNHKIELNNNTFDGIVAADTAYVGDILGRDYDGSGVSIDGAVQAATADSLIWALENGLDTVMTEDVKINPAGMSNAYGTTGINVKNGQTIDGNGYVLDIKGAGGTWDSGISTTGGTIKNITITGSFRGVFVNHNSTHSEKVVLENVIIDGTTYTISCDQGTGKGLEATNCTFKGWTSYAATLGDAKFVDCSFGEGNGYSYCRPYAPTEFVGCDFEEGFTVNPRAAISFENCTVNGVALTAENLTTLISGDMNLVTVK